jgi:hypothetical protein
MPYHGDVNLTIELDREEDKRWIAEALELPGVSVLRAESGRGYLQYRASRY